MSTSYRNKGVQRRKALNLSQANVNRCIRPPMIQPERLPWHMRPLPDHCSAEDVLFFRNWMRELASLNDTLMVTAVDRTKLLRRARSIYFKLAFQLTDQIREMVRRARRKARPESAVGTGRQ